MIKALIFDWGDTVMRDDPAQSGPMCDWDSVSCIPGVPEALQLLSPRYVCIIATNAGDSDTEQMKKALRRVDAEKYFSLFFSSKDLGVEKPKPGFFIEIANLSGLKPSECVHIGNLYEKDIRGARAAGMCTVFFNEKQLEGDFPDADAVICDMRELVDVISEESLSSGGHGLPIQRSKVEILADISLLEEDERTELLTELMRAYVYKVALEDPAILDSITKVVCLYFGIPPDRVMGSTRKKEYALARQLIMYFARMITSFSYEFIGKYCGDRDHATVMHSCSKIELMLESNMQLQEVVRVLKEQLKDVVSACSVDLRSDPDSSDSG